MLQLTMPLHPSKSLLFLVAVLFLCGSAIFLPSMLLARSVVTDVGTEKCGGLEPVGQVVILLYDAMRPDFALRTMKPFMHHHGDCAAPLTEEERALNYTRPTISYIEKSLRSPNDLSHGFFLVADAPTTTAQRVKAIATGSLPAYLEAGANFNSEETHMDSMVQQAEGRAVFMGDDTWTKLFPPDSQFHKYWKQVDALVSFDVADFHSHDQLNTRKIFKTLEAETPESVSASAASAPAHDGKPPPETHARLIIAHFLGIDHIGHRLSADNPAMDAKLEELDDVLHRVVAALHHRQTNMSTMLFVLGDHGMTNSGDHGGDTHQETDTFLFAQYFPGKGTSPSSSSSNSASASARLEASSRLTEERWQARYDEQHSRFLSCRAASQLLPGKVGVANQVDLTPTVTALLGRPLPFSSLGRVIPEVLALSDPKADLERVEECNLRQLERYFAAVGISMKSFPAAALDTTRSVRQRLADISNYSRDNSKRMNLPGMWLGAVLLVLSCVPLLFCAEFWLLLRPGYLAGNIGVALIVMRTLLPISNGLTVNEDVIVTGFYVVETLLLLLFEPLAPRATSLRAYFTSRAYLFRAVPTFLMAVAVRLVSSVGLRHRAHITHHVEEQSQLQRWLLQASMHPWMQDLRLPMVLGMLLWILTAPQRAGRPVLSRGSLIPSLVSTTACCMFYGTPVYHHANKLACAFFYCAPRLLRRSTSTPASHLFYFMLVMWNGSLCNENLLASAIIITYGVMLPALIRSARGIPTPFRTLPIFFLSHAIFFLEGHQYALSTIDWNSSFVGMPFYNMIGGGVLVLSRTFNAFILPIVALRIFDNDSPESFPIRYYQFHLQLLTVVFSTINSFAKKSHLLLYPIFCPKMLFDSAIAVVMLVTLVATLIL